MTKSRAYNIKRNFASGVVKQVMNIVFPFIIRTIVIYYLGSEYQGISGLFSSILQMLSLGDLGFSTAVVFALYKPISEKNNELINALIGYLQRIYKIVGIIVLVVGLCIFPFLKYLISGHIPDDVNIHILYLIYLFNTVISYYLFAYKSALFNAMQREDVVSNINTVTTLAIRLIQIVLLIAFKNYYIFIIVQPLGTIANNILLQVISKKIYPEIVPEGTVPAEVKSNLSKQIKALLVSRIADVARNSLDNIIISSLIGLSAVAVYDNYLYIYSGIRGFFLVLVGAMQASVGNSLVEETVEKNYTDLKRVTFLNMLATGWCTTCLVCLYQPFMDIWMRGNSSLILPFISMMLFCLYFYEINMGNTVNLYLNGNGFYWQLRWWYTIEAVANLILNIALGRKLGIAGILLATIITIFIFNFVPRVNAVFRHYFKCSSREFYIIHTWCFFKTLFVSGLVYFICSIISISGIIGLVLKGLTAVVLSTLLYCLLSFKNEYFKILIGIVRRSVTRKH